MKAVHLGKPRNKLSMAYHVVRLFGPVRRQVSRHPIQEQVFSKPPAALRERFPDGSQPQRKFTPGRGNDPCILLPIIPVRDPLRLPAAGHLCGCLFVKLLHPENVSVFFGYVILYFFLCRGGLLVRRAKHVAHAHHCQHLGHIVRRSYDIEMTIQRLQVLMLDDQCPDSCRTHVFNPGQIQCYLVFSFPHQPLHVICQMIGTGSIQPPRTVKQYPLILLIFPLYIQ